MLEGTVRAGRYNRPDERTLYISGSPAGVAAAMARYAAHPRVVMPFRVAGARLVDLRDRRTCRRSGVDDALLRQDWMAPVDRGEEPASWRAADRVRMMEADGLIDASRHVPGAFHLVLFRWNDAGAATVAVISAA